MGAVEKVLPVHFPPALNLSGLKRKSVGEVGDQPVKRQAVVTPIEQAHPPRNIQPRPPVNGYAPAASISSSPTVTSTGKKRGRPSKADKEAQARASFSRPTEYAPITPAPLAPAAPAPQREYASSPGYEIAGSYMDAKGGKRGKPSGSERSPMGSAYPLPSPASATETPRALPEAIERAGQTQSPRGIGCVAPADSRSLPARSPLQHPLQPQSHALPPIQASAPPPEQYRSDPPRIIDPIFPDRDRSRSAFDPTSRTTPAAPSVTNRN